MRKDFREMPSPSGFSVLEMLVAMTILALLVLLIAQTISLSSKTIQANSRKLDGVSEARFVLDRLGADLNSRVNRSDVPDRFLKRAGNDVLAFYSTIEGFGGERHISVVDYRVQEQATGKVFQLERAVVGTDWGGSSNALKFRPESLPALQDADYDVLSDGVLRLEFCYLGKDGKLSNSMPGDLKDLAGFVVAAAVLDPKSRKTMSDVQLRKLSEALPDSIEGRDPLSVWQEERNKADFASGLPLSAVEGLRFAQRYYYVQ